MNFLSHCQQNRHIDSHTIEKKCIKMKKNNEKHVEILTHLYFTRKFHHEGDTFNAEHMAIKSAEIITL